MTRFTAKTLIIRLTLLLIAAAGPLAFPLSQLGYASLHRLAALLILPGALVLLVSWMIATSRGKYEVARIILWGGISGAVATFALEAVRYCGFRFGFMPGNLPRLMGVLLLDRFALGP